MDSAFASSDTRRARRKSRSVEWPTLGVALTIYSCVLMLVWFHESVPWWLMLPFGAILATLHGSLQHEIIHGHPTPWRQVNDAIGSIPLWLWVPFRLYKKSHLVHHNNDRLTDPLDDPESYYVRSRSWDQLPRPLRTLLLINQTLLGRLTVGVLLMVYGLWRDEAARLRRRDFRHLGIWLEHLAYTAILLHFVVAVAGMPLWFYLVCFAWPGTALTMLRSFDEHRPAEQVGPRCTIVEASLFFRFLYFNNNYHALHHLHPGVAWYRLPALYRATRDEVVRWNAGFVRKGYGEVIRRYALRRRDHPAHPYA